MEQRCRGLMINDIRLFPYNRVRVQTSHETADILISWTWPIESAERHLDWLLGRFGDIVGPEGLMGDLRAWRTRDCVTHEPVTVEGWLTAIRLSTPHRGARSTLTLTIRPFPDIAL